MNTLIIHQRQFLTTGLGGPTSYRGRSLAAAHAGLRITAGEFDAVGGHLTATLAAAGVDPELQAEVLATVAGLRGEVVTA
jgi:hemoglobin